MESERIVLDHTLHDLYSLDSDTDHDVILIPALPIANIQVAPCIPASKKFIVQYPIENADTDKAVWHCFHIMSQRAGFCAGNMPVVTFKLGNPADDGCHHHTDALQVFQQLSRAQQPNMSFVESPASLTLTPASKIAVSIPMDCLVHVKHLVDQDVHYEMLSKRGLAFSGLPTPKTAVV